jgi:hypothetical protein
MFFRNKIRFIKYLKQLEKYFLIFYSYFLKNSKYQTYLIKNIIILQKIFFKPLHKIYNFLYKNQILFNVYKNIKKLLFIKLISKKIKRKKIFKQIKILLYHLNHISLKIKINFQKFNAILNQMNFFNYREFFNKLIDFLTILHSFELDLNTEYYQKHGQILLLQDLCNNFGKEPTLTVEELQKQVNKFLMKVEQNILISFVNEFINILVHLSL